MCFPDWVLHGNLRSTVRRFEGPGTLYFEMLFENASQRRFLQADRLRDHSERMFPFVVDVRFAVSIRSSNRSHPSGLSA